MGVGGRGKTVVVVLGGIQCSRTEVECLHHAACGHDAQHTVEKRIVVPRRTVQTLGQSLVAAHVQINVL